jgi:hypothetical protein
LDCIIKKVDHHMMGSFDIHILDPELYDMVQCISIVFSVSTAAALFYGTRSFREVLGRYAPVTVETCFYLFPTIGVATLQSRPRLY